MLISSHRRIDVRRFRSGDTPRRMASSGSPGWPTPATAHKTPRSYEAKGLAVPGAIVHIIDELKIGGAQTHLVTMVRYAVQTYPIRHYVLSLFGDGPIGDELRNCGVEVIALDLRPELAHRRFDRAISKISAVLRQIKPDLVEAHLTWSRLLGIAAAWMARVPQRIGFEHGDIYMRSLKFRVANFCSQVYTHCYIVCSRALRDWVQMTHRIRGKKITVLHNCVDITRFHAQLQPAPDVAKLKPNGEVLLVMVGTLGKGVNKRVDIGIRALARARQQGANVALAIAGDGELRSELEALTAELEVSEYVSFLGMRTDIPAVLAASDVFCHAAPFEPFGIVAIEAMAVGRPVIVPDSGGIQEAVVHGQTGFVYNALDVESCAKAIVELSRDRVTREEMGVSARREVEARFTVQQYMNQLYCMYGFLN